MTCSRFAPKTNDRTTGLSPLRRRTATSITSQRGQVHQVQEPPWKSTVPAHRRGRHRWFTIRGRCRLVGRRRSSQSRYPVTARVRHRPDPSGTDPQDAARDLAAAEVAVRYAFTAVESTDKPVKIEVEILQDRPTRALLEASRWAALLCVGAMGLKHSAQGRIGSTAAALASSAHCPVAVVRGHDPLHAKQQWVVAEVDESAVSEECYGARSKRRNSEAPRCGC